jgi:tetratricopeptide (TPR) repeat protein
MRAIFRNARMLTTLTIVVLGLLVAAGSVPAQDNNAAKEKFNEGIQAEKDGKLDVALKAYEAAIAADPGFADPYLNLGVIYFGKKDHINAIKNFKKFTELNSSSYDGFKNLGYACVEAKDLKTGAAAFDAGLKLKPNDIELLKGYANLYYKADNWAKAIERYSAYIPVNPSDAKSLTNLAKCYEESDKTTDAVATYQKAIKADPKYYMAHFQLGSLYYAEREYEKAAAEFEKSSDLNKRHWKSFYNLGNARVALETQEDYVDAYRSYKSFLKLTSGTKSNSVKKLQKKAQDIMTSLKDYFEAEAIDYQ